MTSIKGTLKEKKKKKLGLWSFVIMVGPFFGEKDNITKNDYHYSLQIHDDYY